MFREFPGSPAVRSLHFTAEGLGSIPGQVTKILQVTECGQKNLKKGLVLPKYKVSSIRHYL